MRSWPLVLLPAFTLAATAQNNATAKAGTGTVTGHVYCSDTNAPARMARVQLESVKAADQRLARHPQPSSGAPVGDMAKVTPASDASDGDMVQVIPASDVPVGGVVQTTLDGSFVIPNVPPGSYYVVAAAAGYLSPRANADNIDDAEPPASAGQPPVVIPKVSVQADQTSAIDIRLERGAAVIGTIRFDDGSPAAGIHVAVEHKSKDTWGPLNSTDFGIRGSEVTDDLGRYRISGLRDGEYILQIVLFHLDLVPGGRHGTELSGLMRSSLMVYSGDATRRSTAVPFKLGAGEERAGEDISIPLSKLHSISGVVTAARDGHAINGGNLDIRVPEDNETIMDAEIGNDGAFHLESVPEGSYILRIHNARDKQMQDLAGPGNMTITSEKTLHPYGDLEQAIKVEGDIPNLVLVVPEQTKQHASQ